MELHEDLAHHAHAGFRALAGQGQRVEVLHDAAHRAAELRLAHAALELVLAGVHPVLEQAVRAARLHLVGARAIQAHHEQIAVLQRVNGLVEHLRRDLEARVLLAQVLEGDGDDRDVPEPHGLQRLADERDVVGGAAAAAGLGDEHGQLVGVVLARQHRFHNLARDQDGRVADVVVHVLQARVHRAVVHRGQKRHVVAGALEDGHQKLEVVGGHLGRQNRPALIAHLLGELGARELGGGALALLDLGRGHHAIGLLGEAGGHELIQVVQVDARSRTAPLLGGGVGFRLGLAVGLVLQGRQKTAHANARRAQVRHLVDLQHRVHLAGRFQHLLHLIGGEGIQAASEGVQLNEIEILTLGDHLGRRVQARVVHPLIHHANGPLQLAQVRHGVLGEHGQTEAREQLGDGVVDLGILMVGASGQHDAAGAGLLHPREGFHALRADIAFERLVLGPGRLHRRPDLVSRERGAAPVRLFRKVLGQLHHQALGQLVLVVVGHPRRHEGHIGLAQLVDVQAQRLGVTRHNGAVEVVAGGLVLLALPLGTGHPDEVRVLREQVHDVAVRELRRIAHALGGHRLDAGLVGLLRGGIRQHHAVAQLREEGEPERVVLVHVQRARDAHGAAGRVFGGQGLVAEGALGFVLEQVRNGRLLGAGAQTLALLAAVAGDEAAVLARRRIDAEIVHREQAGVRAALAAHGAMRRRERLDFLKRQKSA